MTPRGTRAYCVNCGQSGPSDARFCSRCGARTPAGQYGSPSEVLPNVKPTSRTLKVFLGIGAVCVLSVGVLSFHESRLSEQRREDNERKKREADAVFTAMTPSQHVQKAQEGLKGPLTADAIAEGLRNVREVPPDAPESAQAKALEQKLLKAQTALLNQIVAQEEENRIAGLSPRERATEETKILKFGWEKSGFGAVMLGDFTIRNSSPYDVKDIEVRCSLSGPSGTVIDHNTRTIYDIVKARSTRVFRSVNMGFIASQSARSGCEIIGVSLVSVN